MTTRSKRRPRSISNKLAAGRRRARREGWISWVTDETDERALAEDYYFDKAAAGLVRDFCRLLLHHSKGQWAGQAFRLLPWEWRQIIGPVFGWKRPDGTRRYRTVYIEVPKKNGKSTLGSAICLYLLVADNEPGAEVYCAAVDREQASIIYNEAAAMVEGSSHLARRLHIVRSAKRIIYPGTNSYYKALSADVPTKEGLNIHGLVFDELHAQPSRKMWDTLRYGGSARRQPLLMSITTAGTNRKTICWEQHQYAKNVANGLIQDLAFYGLIYGAKAEDDWTSPRVWRRCNPSLGHTITAAGMKADCDEAKATPSKSAGFRRRRLNIWIEAANPWLDLHLWDAGGDYTAADAGIKFGPVASEMEAQAIRDRYRRCQLQGRTCWAGLDLATTKDLTALVLLFPDPANPDHIELLPWFFAPRENAIRREEIDHVPYLAWADFGLIELTEGNVTDYNVIRRVITGVGPDGKKHGRPLADLYGIRDIAVDRLFQGAQLSTDLQADGMIVTSFGQGYYSMAAPAKEFERRVLSRQVHHGDHPVLRWQAANVVVRTDAAGNIKPDRETSLEKIDAIVATVMALGRQMTEPDDPNRSVYDDRGLMSV